jgi:predicted DNA-binding transcriptional regulator AlpA
MSSKEGLPMKVLTYEKLQELGWPYSKSHTWRLVRAGKFPAPKKLGLGPNARNVWPEDEYEAVIKTLLSGQSS